MKAENPGPRLRQLALCLVVVGALGSLAELWWTSHRANVNFLPGMAPAEWILYPVIPDAMAHRVVELPTTFAESFALDTVPPRALLRIAGFHRYTLAINGESPGRPLRTGTNWKQPDEFDVAGQLRPGANRIEATVFNSDGPPALWLALDAGVVQVNSEAGWETSYAGAIPSAAVLASASKPTAAGSSSYGLPSPLAALAMCWPTLLLFALLSATGFWLLHILEAFPAQARGFPLATAQAKGKVSCREWLPVVVLAVAWLVLFVHNLPLLPNLTGFDAQGHMDYIGYIQEHRSLPLAQQGVEMFQPPLYYLVSATWLSLLHRSVSDAGGIAALRLLGLAIGITHFVVVWATLRMILPAGRLTAGLGVVLAACLPPMLYLGHYVTNETLAALLVSTSVWLTVRTLKAERLEWASCAKLGLCLGGALLAKPTALLVLPPIFGALLWKWLENRSQSPGRLVARLGMILALCALVTGWHYARAWIHYGNPLVSNMSREIGYSWWQDNGYRTSSFYLRFGEALRHPWSGTFQGFWDGMYATLWGDGLLGGATISLARPLWNYELMVVGYWLALLPTLAVLTGGVLAFVRFVRRPSAEQFLFLAFGCLVIWALVHMSLVIPAQMKAFYGLSALVPFCFFGVSGLDILTRRSLMWRSFACVLVGLWAVNSYACFWISRSSAPAAVERACALVRKANYADAIDFLKQRLRSEPDNAELQFALAYFLTTDGRIDEGAGLAELMVRQHPEDCRGHHVLALALAVQHQPGKAIDEFREVMALSPGYDPFWETLASLLVEQGDPGETISLTRQALVAAPFSPELRLALGYAFAQKGQGAEASDQFRYACQLSPKAPDTLAALAWKLATDPVPAQRNGAVAVRLAEQARGLAADQRKNYAVILAAAYAEAARFPEAIRTAEQAQAAALAAGDSAGASLARQLIDLFKNGQPYREGPEPDRGR